jgi:hypothetical protein
MWKAGGMDTFYKQGGKIYRNQWKAENNFCKNQNFMPK